MQFYTNLRYGLIIYQCIDVDFLFLDLETSLSEIPMYVFDCIVLNLIKVRCSLQLIFVPLLHKNIIQENKCLYHLHTVANMKYSILFNIQQITEVINSINHTTLFTGLNYILRPKISFFYLICLSSSCVSCEQ